MRLLQQLLLLLIIGSFLSCGLFRKKEENTMFSPLGGSPQDNVPLTKEEKAQKERIRILKTLDGPRLTEDEAKEVDDIIQKQLSKIKYSKKEMTIVQMGKANRLENDAQKRMYEKLAAKEYNTVKKIERLVREYYMDKINKDDPTKKEQPKLHRKNMNRKKKNRKRASKFNNRHKKRPWYKRMFGIK